MDWRDYEFYSSTSLCLHCLISLPIRVHVASCTYNLEKYQVSYVYTFSEEKGDQIIMLLILRCDLQETGLRA